MLYYFLHQGKKYPSENNSHYLLFFPLHWMNRLIHGLNECLLQQEWKGNLTTQFRETSKINDSSAEDDSCTSPYQSNFSTF
jgi:hypothetical protein